MARRPASVPAGLPDSARLSTAQVSAIRRFPDDNPNPVMRFDDEGRLVYANPASADLLDALGGAIGNSLPPELVARLREVELRRGSIELAADHRTYAVWPVHAAELGFTNLYGRDITAEKAIARFPDDNPNPVLRFGLEDGVLMYANPASAGLMAGLGLALGGCLPAELRAILATRAAAHDRTPVEIDAGDRRYALVPVDSPEFGFCNVYGTDITAARERERLAAENERLLMNILPEPIARRLREGEPMIADRYDDVTLLFADIVEFTRLSATMTPSELVTVLNDVFAAFDGLVDRTGLEKVKTIGDAYMVVGGLPDPLDDHTARVATMALELADAVDRIDSASRLGIRFRIGIHCGPVVAGVIGKRKFIYDVWGDTVNMASRMESLGVPGRIQVSHAVRERLGNAYRFEPRGLIDVKGKGPTPTWFLVGRADGGHASLVATPLASDLQGGAA